MQNSKTQFSKDFDQTFGSRILNTSNLNLSVANQNSTFLKTEIFNASLINETSFRTDINYINNVINDCRSQIKEGETFDNIQNSYINVLKNLARTNESNYLKNLPIGKKNLVLRESSRLFDLDPMAVDFKSKIRRIVNWRIDQLKRDKKDFKWNLIKTAITSLMYKNKENRDVFECISMRELPYDIRQIIWKIFLEDEEISQEYKKLFDENRLLTLSQFDHQISRDCEEFIVKIADKEEFDGSMLLCMKTILSYYEKRNDRILSDYLYQICIPLVHLFGNMKVLHSKPTDLISYFFTIQKIVFEFDPFVDLLVKHDINYDAVMTDYFMNSLSLIDESLTKKITEILDLEKEANRRLLVLLIKKFVHSLGFAFLSMRITLFVWDQIFMKIRRNQAEIFLVMGISFFCLKEEILECKDWDYLLNCYYGNAKKIEFDIFYEKYCQVFDRITFYLSEYGLQLEKKQIDFNPQQNLSVIEEKNILDNSSIKSNLQGKQDQNDSGGSKNQIKTKKKEILKNSNLKKEEELSKSIDLKKNEELSKGIDLTKNEQKQSLISSPQKNQKVDIIPPSFVARFAKNQEKLLPDNYGIDENDLQKNLIVINDEKNQDSGLIPKKSNLKNKGILKGFNNFSNSKK